jgi:glycerol kinase
MQLQADLLQCPLATSSNHEVSAQGAAFMAGIKAGLWSTDDIERIHEASLEKFYQPTGSLEDLEEFIAGWHEAVRRSLQWAN